MLNLVPKIKPNHSIIPRWDGTGEEKEFWPGNLSYYTYPDLVGRVKTFTKFSFEKCEDWNPATFSENQLETVSYVDAVGEVGVRVLPSRRFLNDTFFGKIDKNYLGCPAPYSVIEKYKQLENGGAE